MQSSSIPPSNCNVIPIVFGSDNNKHTAKSKCFQYINERLKRVFSVFLKTISYLFKSIVSRTPKGKKISCNFTHNADSIDKKNFESFKKYDVTPIQPYLKNPISPSMNRKGFQLINEYLNKREIALANNDVKALPNIENLLTKSCSLVFKANDQASCRYDFNIDDWEILDNINFQLIEEHFNTLNELFNSSLFDHISTTLKQAFGLDYKNAYLAEVLSLSLAPGMTYEDKVLNIPTQQNDGTWKLLPHKIHQLSLGDRLPAWVLQSPHAPPWLVIRGTETISGKSQDGRDFRPGSHESLLADLIDPQGISLAIISKAMCPSSNVSEHNSLHTNNLTTFFLDCKARNIKPKLCGHSLGGCLVNDISVRFWHYIDKAYAFSPPGVSITTEKNWQQKQQQEAQLKNVPLQFLPEKLFNIMYEGDFVPSAGKRLIGTCLAIHSLLKLPIDDPSFRHIHLHLNNPFEIYLIDRNAENRKFARKISEGLRISTGSAIRCYYALFNRKQLPSWWTHRHHYHLNAKKIENLHFNPL